MARITASYPAAKVIAACLLLSVCLQHSAGSAIPIWEFFTRNEKVSYLYSTFAELVSVHCKATAATSNVPVNQCKRNLLAYGYERLQSFSEQQLDEIDPYQRGANEIIWASIMRDHASSTLVTTRKPLPTPPASSIIILTPQKDAADTVMGAASTPIRPNPLFVDADKKHSYAMDMDMAYGYNGQHAPVAARPGGAVAATTATTYLNGPLVIRVRPDGTPVAEDRYRPLPRDDDLDAFQLGGSSSSSSNSNGNGNSTPAPARQNKHRKIASISSLKQQHLATLALQQQLQPPYAHAPRYRRQFQSATAAVHRPQQQSQSVGYHYGKGQP